MEQNYLIYLLEAVVTTIVLGTIAIPLLKKLKARQSVREEGISFMTGNQPAISAYIWIKNIRSN